MSRLIIIPQYPTPLRYQEWWINEFPKQFKNHFDDVLVLHGKDPESIYTRKGGFAPICEAIAFEQGTIDQYMNLTLEKGDILLLNDLSFPGFFAHALFHKRPDKCFAICHATSKNRYDYFAKSRPIKYPIEKATARLFDKIFVASRYHANKLGWKNIEVQGFPMPPFTGVEQTTKSYSIVSVARPSIQKRTQILEQRLQRDLNHRISTASCNTWKEYYTFLSKAKILLITSKEETYGYQVVDAILNECIPIAPNALSYPELLPKEYLYNNYEELKELVTKIIHQSVRSFFHPDEPQPIPVPPLLTEREAQYFYIRILLHMKGKI